MSQSTKYICPICRHEFGKEERSNCHLCADKGRCTLICCPNCGYSFPDNRDASTDKRSILGWLRRRAKKQAD